MNMMWKPPGFSSTVLTGWNDEPTGDGAHRHHAVVDAHLMDFRLCCALGSDADKLVVGRTGVGEFEVSAADLGAWHHGTCMRMANCDVAGA